MKRILTGMAVLTMVAMVPLATATATTTTATRAAHAAHATVHVTIENFAFSPAKLTVAPGTTVVWLQKDTVGHTVTSDTNAWTTSPLLDQGKTFSYTFTKAGSYSYHCGPHPYMQGTVTVSGSASSAGGTMSGAGKMAVATYGAATLNPLGSAKVTGGAALFLDGKSLLVAVSVSGLKPMSTHAEHIHAGVCGSNGKILYPLPNLVADSKGNASATIKISAMDVPSAGKMGWYVNVHSDDATLTPISCGDVHHADMMIRLKGLDGSKGSGVALLTAHIDTMGMTTGAMAKGTEVVVFVKGLQSNAALPEHLHTGTCGSNGAIKYALTNVLTDKAGMGVAATYLKGITPTTGLYVNVHATSMKPVVCGNLMMGM